MFSNSSLSATRISPFQVSPVINAISEGSSKRNFLPKMVESWLVPCRNRRAFNHCHKKDHWAIKNGSPIIEKDTTTRLDVHHTCAINSAVCLSFVSLIPIMSTNFIIAFQSKSVDQMSGMLERTSVPGWPCGWKESVFSDTASCPQLPIATVLSLHIIGWRSKPSSTKTTNHVQNICITRRSRFGNDPYSMSRIWCVTNGAARALVLVRLIGH